MSDTPHLDRVMLAAERVFDEGGNVRPGMTRAAEVSMGGGRTRDYTREEHGRLQHVSGYIRMLDEMTPHVLTDAQAARLHSDLERGMGTHDMIHIKRSIASAHAAYTSHDYLTANAHLASAADRATYTDAKALRDHLRAGRNYMHSLFRAQRAGKAPQMEAQGQGHPEGSVSAEKAPLRGYPDLPTAAQRALYREMHR